MSAPSGVTAAMRDASLYKSPGTARRYHVVVDGPPGGDGKPADVPACNRVEQYRSGAMPLDMDAATDAAYVAEVLRCKRRPCAARWPA